MLIENNLNQISLNLTILFISYSKYTQFSDLYMLNVGSKTITVVFASRLTDYFLLLLPIVNFYGTWNYINVLYEVVYIHILTIITLCVFLTLN